MLDDEGIRLAKQHGAYLSMDIYNTDYTQSEGKKNGVLEDNLRKDRELGDIQRENFRRAHQAGVKMVYGTDAGIFPHGDNAKQFPYMVRYGMTPMQAIQSATIEAARLLDKHDELGSVAPGKAADLVAMRCNPVEKIECTAEVQWVIRDGVIIQGKANK